MSGILIPAFECSNERVVGEVASARLVSRHPTQQAEDGLAVFSIQRQQVLLTAHGRPSPPPCLGVDQILRRLPRTVELTPVRRMTAEIRCGPRADLDRLPWSMPAKYTASRRLTHGTGEVEMGLERKCAGHRALAAVVENVRGQPRG